MSAAEALEEKWKEHFEITGADWLIPYIELLAQGIPFSKADILLAFERIPAGLLPATNQESGSTGLRTSAFESCN